MTRYAQGMIGAAFVSGCALVMAAIFLPGKLGLAILGYLLAFVGGHMLALFKAERFLPPALVAVVVLMPRVVEQPYPESALNTGVAPYLGMLAFATVGAAMTVAADATERRIVLIPAVLCWLGVLTAPETLLVDPAVGWLSATGALMVLGRRWSPKPWGVLTLALIAGAVSIFLLIPGFRAGIAVLPLSWARPFGVFGNPLVANDSIMLMTAAVVTTLSLRKVLALAALTLGATAALWTGSRTGLLCLAYLGLAHLAGWFPRPRLLGRWKLALFGGVAMALYLIYFGTPDLGRAGGLSTDEGSWVARAAGFQEGVVGALSHPFGTASIEVSSSFGVTTTYENIFFDIGAHMGWLVLTGTIAGFVLTFRACTSTGRVEIGLLVLVGLTAAIYYHPSVYMVAFICAGVMTQAAEREPLKAIQSVKSGVTAR